MKNHHAIAGLGFLLLALVSVPFILIIDDLTGRKIVFILSFGLASAQAGWHLASARLAKVTMAGTHSA